MGGGDLEEMSKQNSGGEEKGIMRQKSTSDGFGRAREQIGEKSPPRVAKYNVHGCD